MSLSADLSAPASGADAAHVDPRFAEYRSTGDRSLRDALIEDHRWVGLHCARRFLRRGVPTDDLVQVAMVGLVKAVDRFDPGLGNSFTTFAVPTITGELRRYFRDCTWGVRVRRRDQEHYLVVKTVVDEMQQVLGRAPTIAEIAQRTGLGVGETLEALAVGNAYRSAPLEIGDDDEDGDQSNQSICGIDEPGYARSEARTVLPGLLAALPSDRERRIIELRFVEDMSQSKIAAELGLSQVHVSRLLRQSLRHMRQMLPT
jgi:RNA polymerase sigma-B factor